MIPHMKANVGQCQIYVVPSKNQNFFFRKYFNLFCGEPCVGFIMTKCYDGKNAKTNACGSGIQAPSCCYAYAFSQFGQKLYELAFKSFYSSSSLLKMFFFSISTSDSYLPSIFGSNPRKQYFCSLNTFGTLSLNKEFAEIQYLSFLLECPLNSRPQKPRCELF